MKDMLAHSETYMSNDEIECERKLYGNFCISLYLKERI